MNYEIAKHYFEKFLKDNFDINDEKISHKINHTYNVVENTKYLCECLELDKKNTELAMIIALLHDIGRFDQAKEMKSFREDITNFDHATLGVKLLFEKGEIKNYMDDADLVTGIKLVYTMKDSPSPKKASSSEASGKGGKKRNDPDDQSGRKTKASAEIPAKPASVKVKAGKNKVTVSWKKIGRSEGDKKLRAQIKGVQIQYSTDPKFKKSRVTKKVGRDRTKAVLKLKKKKTYYIRLRYFGSGGTSKWTEAKKVSIGN